MIVAVGRDVKVMDVPGDGTPLDVLVVDSSTDFNRYLHLVRPGGVIVLPDGVVHRTEN